MGITGWVMTGFAAVVAAMLWLTVRSGGQWRRKLDDLLLPVGFARCDDPADHDALAPRLRMLQRRHEGRRRLLHLYRRDAGDGGYRLYVGDYRFASAGGRTSGASWLIVILVAPGRALPPLAISAIPRAPALLGRLARALDTHLEVPGMHRVASGDPALDAHFVVRLGTGVSHSAWIQPALELLARSGAEPSLDAEGDTLVLGSIALQADRVRQVLDGQKLQVLMHLADQLHRRLGGPAAPQT